jgi:transcriptional regulator with XRE-family HTH domain
MQRDLGLSFNAITKIEQSAAKHSTLQTFIKLTDAFEIGLDELVGRLVQLKGGQVSDMDTY